MFEGLSSRFEGILRKVRGRGRLGPEDVEEFLAEVRVALLEADVHLDVVRTLLDRIRDRAVGVEVAGALNPGQIVVKIVLEELTAVLGGETFRPAYASRPPTVVLLAGLQERRVALEGEKDPGLERIIHRIQRQTDVERGIRIVWEWFDGFQQDRADEIRRLKETPERS